MQKCNYGVVKPVSADKTCQEQRDRKRVPFGAAHGLPRLRTAPGLEEEGRGLASPDSEVTTTFEQKPACCKLQVQSWPKKNELPSLPIQRAAPFMLGHTASHPVCPQRGKGSRVGCSRPYLPCTSLLHLFESCAFCVEAISYAFIWRAEHRDLSSFPLAAQHSSRLMAGWCFWAKTLILISLLSFCVSFPRSLQVFSLQLLITVPELAATTHSSRKTCHPSRFNPAGPYRAANSKHPHIGSALLLHWALDLGTNPGQPWNWPRVTVHKG